MSAPLEITAPDDWHIHLRDGPYLARTVADCAAQFARALAMPNLVPPVTNASELHAYRERILAAVPAGVEFEPVLTLYLTDRTTPQVIAEALAAGAAGAKLYPAGATTNSAAGVTGIEALLPALEALAEGGGVLQIHGEVTDRDVDIFDREAVFIERTLAPLVERLPELKVVLEHITTAEAAAFVAQAPAQVAATITAHHLAYNRNHMLVGGIRPHYYCLPILKRARHQTALRQAAVSGSPKFFLGTDSAPHAASAKESSCGCAGAYTAPTAMELYAEVFAEEDALDRLEAFASHFGADFYGRPRNRGRLRLEEAPWQVPESLSYGDSTIKPLLGGSQLRFRARRVA